MGGDHGPSEVVPGALDHARNHGEDRLILVGDEATIRRLAGSLPPNVSIVHASEVIRRRLTQELASAPRDFFVATPEAVRRGRKP